MTKEHIMPITLIVIGTLLAFTISAWAGALGKANLLEEQVKDWQDSTKVAHQVTVDAEAQTDSIILITIQQEAEATIAIANSQAEVIRLQAAGETSFLRAQGLASENPILQQAIEEMRGDAIVIEMAFEEERAVSAAALFQAQQQNRTLTTSLLSERTAHRDELFTVQTSLTLAIERGDILERVIAPGFFANLIQNGKLAGIAAVVGGAITYAVVR